jgi:hypothetical protein
MDDQINQLRAHAMVDAHKAAPISDQTLEFARVLIAMRELYLRKNAAYGPDAIGDTELYGIAVRMNDKIKRVLHITRTENARDDETLEDTMLDLAVYAAIAVVWMRGKWGK